MKTIAIMQPYFFPYIGYFQLINASNMFVNLDHVQYIKRSYITRNTLKDGIEINIPVIGASQNKSCREVYADCTDKWFEKFEKTLYLNYHNEKNFITIYDEILGPWCEDIRWYKKEYENVPISIFNKTGISLIIKYLNINIDFVVSSESLTNQKREKGLQEIVKICGGTHYINAIGGQKLYTKEDFASQEIDLKFIKNNSQLPTTSILDLLFRYNKELIKQELNNYELI